MQLASFSELMRSHTIELAKSTARVLKYRSTRTADVVEAEYHSGHWGKLLQDQPWRKAATLEDYLIGTDARLRLAKVENRLVSIATNDYYKHRIGAIQELFRRHAGDGDQILELGSGSGYNVFSLSLDPRWRQIRGLDISQNGIAAARMIADHYGLASRLHFDSIDLTDDSHPGYNMVPGSIVFTYFCLEQLPDAVEAVIQSILRRKPRRVLNIEPNAEFLNFTDPRDIVSFARLRSVDYQRRLFRHLDQLEAQGVIRILARERMAFAPTLYNDGLLYCWEPVSS